MKFYSMESIVRLFPSSSVIFSGLSGLSQWHLQISPRGNVLRRAVEVAYRNSHSLRSIPEKSDILAPISLNSFNQTNTIDDRDDGKAPLSKHLSSSQFTGVVVGMVFVVLLLLFAVYFINHIRALLQEERRQPSYDVGAHTKAVNKAVMSAKVAVSTDDEDDRRGSQDTGHSLTA